mmetsp:Transcript_13549/g.24479  ORF Transcript_13549/g.24479 Transcript_13549/m.24479 type:complete len:99 (-) Transcript_13549:70-366(-)
MVPCLPIPNQAATSTHVAITKLLNLNPYSHNVGSFMLHSCRRTTGGNISISQHRIHPDNVVQASFKLHSRGQMQCMKNVNGVYCFGGSTADNTIHVEV